MVTCHDMQEGDVFVCKTCGMELQVTKACKDAADHTKSDDCCSEESNNCLFECCGDSLIKKA